jgi:antirestriction protein ArdC
MENSQSNHQIHSIMNYNSKENKDKQTMAEKAVDRFTEMMIERMEQMKGHEWTQGWIGTSGTYQGLPQNMSGRCYSGHNDFFLQLNTAMKGYRFPVYATFKQIAESGAAIIKGEKAMPVIYWNIQHSDDKGNRVSEEQYDNMSREERKKLKTIPFMKAYYVFNIDQTDLKEVKPKLYDKLEGHYNVQELRDQTGMYVSPELECMFENQDWDCPIDIRRSDSACYSASQDRITLPLKEQFNIGKTPEEVYKDGMEFYSSALHEMAHSTGSKTRLNRLEGGQFGNPEYAKEELVAELSAAMVGNALGFDKRILDNNAKYLDGWIAIMRENPKFIVSVMADVSKASKMILDSIDFERLKMGVDTLQPKEEAVLDDNGKIVNTPRAESVDAGTAEQLHAEKLAKAFKTLKEKHPDAVILLRNGDFYESFGEDAVKVSAATGLSKQSIVNDGLPDDTSYVNFKCTSLERYLPQLIKAGNRVAICDSLNDLFQEEKGRRSTAGGKAQDSPGKLSDSEFNGMSLENGQQINHFAVFKTHSGSYALRAMVDGQQLNIKPLDKADRNAFFLHTASKASLVQKYYDKELSTAMAMKQTPALRR